MVEGKTKPAQVYYRQVHANVEALEQAYGRGNFTGSSIKEACKTMWGFEGLKPVITADGYAWSMDFKAEFLGRSNVRILLPWFDDLRHRGAPEEREGHIEVLISGADVDIKAVDSLVEKIRVLLATVTPLNKVVADAEQREKLRRAERKAVYASEMPELHIGVLEGTALDKQRR